MIDNDQSTIIEAPEVYKSIPTHSPTAKPTLGGPPPGFPQSEHFLCGTSTEKASREGPNIQGIQQDRG